MEEQDTSQNNVSRQRTRILAVQFPGFQIGDASIQTLTPGKQLTTHSRCHLNNKTMTALLSLNGYDEKRQVNAFLPGYAETVS